MGLFFKSNNSKTDKAIQLALIEIQEMIKYTKEAKRLSLIDAPIGIYIWPDNEYFGTSAYGGFEIVSLSHNYCRLDFIENVFVNGIYEFDTTDDKMLRIASHTITACSDLPCNLEKFKKLVFEEIKRTAPDWAAGWSISSDSMMYN